MAAKGDPIYDERKILAIKAFETGCMLFSSDTQKWYTPKEFLASDEVIKTETYSMHKYSNIVLHSPKGAIAFELEKLHKANKEFDSFLNRVFNAFEMHPIGKDKKQNT